MKSKSTKITISLYCLIPPIQWLPIFVASKLGSIFPYVLTTTDSTSPFMGPNPLCKDTVYLPTLGSKQHVSEDEDGWISSQTSPELQGMLGFNPFNLKNFRQNGFIFPQFRCEKTKKMPTTKIQGTTTNTPENSHVWTPKIMEVNDSNDVPLWLKFGVIFLGEPNQLGSKWFSSVSRWWWCGFFNKN